MSKMTLNNYNQTSIPEKLYIILYPLYIFTTFAKIL